MEKKKQKQKTKLLRKDQYRCVHFTRELPEKKTNPITRIDSREIGKFSEFQLTPTGPNCSVLTSALG